MAFPDSLGVIVPYSAQAAETFFHIFVHVVGFACIGFTCDIVTYVAERDLVTPLGIFGRFHGESGESATAEK